MTKFICTESASGTSIKKGALVEGFVISKDRFYLCKCLDDLCSKNHEKVKFPMKGQLWEWEEVRE